MPPRFQRALAAPRPARARRRRTALCGVLALAAAATVPRAGVAAEGDAALPEGVVLAPSRSLRPMPRGDAARELPAYISARELRARPDLDAEASGEVDFRRGGVRIEADRLHYDQSEDRARASGSVRIYSEGNVYRGPEAEMKVQRFEGYFLEPTYFFGRTGAGGSAERVDFLDADRSIATGATYSSCTPDGGGTPDWILRADKVGLDFERNEGVAEGAKLRFLGVTLLSLPRLSFPLTDARKSGWLPPAITLDNRSGLQVGVPYYWNIAPNRDATLTPQLASRRGAGLDAEYRYLEPAFRGLLHANVLPYDLVAGRSRYALDVRHEGRTRSGWDLWVRSLRVSDDDYWKDFPRILQLNAPRLLPTDLRASRTRDWSALPWLGAKGDWTAYARVLRWQPIGSTDSASAIVPPYERLPQLGVRTRQRLAGGIEAALETEINRFAPPAGFDDATRERGVRVHAVGSFARPWGTPGWTITPRVAFNAASYDFEPAGGGERRRASRLIPTASIDSAWFFERDTRLLGRDVRQTLEPRLHYVRTPFREQSDLPNFDAARKDFNVDSIYTDNDFSGIDRVSDANQLTGGVTTRLIGPDSGAELVRLGIVQRYLFADQRITADGVPLTQRFSDVLLFGATSLVPNWTIDGSLQYNPTTHSTARSILRARYSPGPFRTINATYRVTQGLSEQMELGWQWPIAGPEPFVMEERRRAGQAAAAAGSGGGASCGGSWYTVGRLRYSLKDSRLVDSLVGFEYDAGCWIGRVVAERLSTGLSEATTRLLLQLELVGLSRLGSNPLQSLKDNIPGYRLLRDDRAVPRQDPAAPMNERLRPRLLRRRAAALLALGLAATLAQAQLRMPGQRPGAPAAAGPSTAAPPGGSGLVGVPRGSPRAAERGGDYIVAVVNQELVTAGEVQQRVARIQQEAARSGAKLPPPEQLRQQVLDALIDERVQVTYARETAPRVDDAEIERAVANVAAQNQIPLPQLRERLRREGIDYARFRANLREQIMVERVREREVQSRIQVTDREIDALLERQRAAAGSAASYNVAQVLVTVPEGAGEAVVAERRARAEAALARIRAGEPFDKVAREVSEDGNRANGGEIGLRQADRLPDVFVEVVRSLQPGQVAPTLLRTGAGFHVLKLLDRSETGAFSITQTHARHILLRPSPQLSSEAALRRLADFKRQIETSSAPGRTFEQLARDYSQDASAAQGGDLGWASPGMFVPEFEQAMNDLQPGEIADPVVTRFGVHLIQVLERRRVALDPKQQREQARNILREQKFEEAYQSWARELRARAYVELREPPT